MVIKIDKSRITKEIDLDVDSLLTKIIRIYRFNNEKKFYLYILKNKIKLDYIANVYDVSKSKIILEKVVAKDLNDYDLLLTKLYEFQNQNFNYHSIIHKFLLHLTNPFFGVIRLYFDSISKGYIRFSLKHLLLMLKSYNGIEKHKNVINIHKDFRNNENILWKSKSKLVFIDFETMYQSNKWLLNDIVDFSYDPIEMSINTSLILEFRNRYYPLVNEIEIFSQVRISALRKSFSYLIYNWNNKIDRDALRQFIIDTILNDQNLNTWINSYGN